MKRAEKGLTLSELLTVVVIIGVMAALVLPRFIRQDERGIVAEAVAHLSAIRQAEEAWSLEQTTPAYTATLTNLDIDLTQTKFTYAVVAATGTATATRQPTGSCTISTSPTGNYNGCTISLTAAGVWGGTHPFRPTNPT